MQADAVLAGTGSFQAQGAGDQLRLRIFRRADGTSCANAYTASSIGPDGKPSGTAVYMHMPTGYPVDPTTLTRLSLSSIPNDISYYLTNRSGYEQRKFQLGFKLTF